MIYAEADREKAKYERHKEVLTAHMQELNKRISVVYRRGPARTFQDHVAIADELSRLRGAVGHATARLQRLDYIIGHMHLYVQSKVESTAYLCGCPSNGCRGFIGGDHKCKLCDTRVCDRCHLVLDGSASHVCDEGDVKTAQLLLKDTKGCPTCATPIHKIEGCDQMFCVRCNTAFSWKTLEIETGRIHNPHFYETLREQAGGGNIRREIGDIPCGGLPSHLDMFLFIRSRRLSKVFNPKTIKL
jgi:hypothetical protein